VRTSHNFIRMASSQSKKCQHFYHHVDDGYKNFALQQEFCK